MQARMKERVQELEKIKEIKKKLKHIKTYPVRVNRTTVLFVRVGKDKDAALESFRQRVAQGDMRDSKNESPFYTNPL